MNRVILSFTNRPSNRVHIAQITLQFSSNCVECVSVVRRHSAISICPHIYCYRLASLRLILSVRAIVELQPQNCAHSMEYIVTKTILGVSRPLSIELVRLYRCYIEFISHKLTKLSSDGLDGMFPRNNDNNHRRLPNYFQIEMFIALQTIQFPKRNSACEKCLIQTRPQPHDRNETERESCSWAHVHILYGVWHNSLCICLTCSSDWMARLKLRTPNTNLCAIRL